MTILKILFRPKKSESFKPKAMKYIVFILVAITPIIDLNAQDKVIWDSTNHPGNIFREGGFIGIRTQQPKEALQIGKQWTFHDGGHKIMSVNAYYNKDEKKFKRILNGAASNLRFTSKDKAPKIHIQLTDSAESEEEINWFTALTLSKDGVGVGKSNPSHKLDVHGKINASGYLLNGAPVNLNGLWNSSGDNNTTGGLGIGTPTPDPNHKLHVVGSIYTTEVKVDINAGSGPDYVFSPSYDLPTLKETEEYIKTHSHLPEIPSAKEMESNGLELGEMNLLLLKKIEELTLYVIKQNHRINELENKTKTIDEAYHEN